MIVQKRQKYCNNKNYSNNYGDNKNVMMIIIILITRVEQ